MSTPVISSFCLRPSALFCPNTPPLVRGGGVARRQQPPKQGDVFISLVTWSRGCPGANTLLWWTPETWAQVSGGPRLVVGLSPGPCQRALEQDAALHPGSSCSSPTSSSVLKTRIWDFLFISFTSGDQSRTGSRCRRQHVLINYQYLINTFSQTSGSLKYQDHNKDASLKAY